MIMLSANRRAIWRAACVAAAACRAVPMPVPVQRDRRTVARYKGLLRAEPSSQTLKHIRLGLHKVSYDVDCASTITLQHRYATWCVDANDSLQYYTLRLPAVLLLRGEQKVLSSATMGVVRAGQRALLAAMEQLIGRQTTRSAAPRTANIVSLTAGPRPGAVVKTQVGDVRLPVAPHALHKKLFGPMLNRGAAAMADPWEHWDEDFDHKNPNGKRKADIPVSPSLPPKQPHSPPISCPLYDHARSLIIKLASVYDRSILPFSLGAPLVTAEKLETPPFPPILILASSCWHLSPCQHASTMSLRHHSLGYG